MAEAAAPFKGLGVDLTVRAEPAEDGTPRAPTLKRSPEVLHALGAFIENAVSFADTRGGGDMGLGFFIAKTLIERTGGRIATRNRTPPKRGAVVQTLWPLTLLQAPDLD